MNYCTIPWYKKKMSFGLLWENKYKSSSEALPAKMTMLRYLPLRLVSSHLGGLLKSKALGRPLDSGTGSHCHDGAISLWVSTSKGNTKKIVSSSSSTTLPERGRGENVYFLSSTGEKKGQGASEFPPLSEQMTSVCMCMCVGVCLHMCVWKCICMCEFHYRRRIT